MQGIIKIQWGEFDQSTIYSYMEIPQWNPFVQLVYANRKEK
jgi:hypothetical protein